MMIKALQLVLLWSFYNLSLSVTLYCPKHAKGDPQGVNERIKKIASVKNNYEVVDKSDPKETYTYQVQLCKETPNKKVAVTQRSSLPKGNGSLYTLGTFLPDAPDVFGGTDWIMIKYKKGDSYGHHCGGNNRNAVVMLTCNPSVEKGDIKILEEFRSSDSNLKHDCYYLFELNVAGACTTPPKKMSAGSIMIIILIVVASLYFGLGFLYMRFLVGAKGKEQIPNYSFWREFGNLQADGCNFICRCSDSRPARYKTMDDAIGDDNDEEERDETLLPM